MTKRIDGIRRTGSVRRRPAARVGRGRPGEAGERRPGFTLAELLVAMAIIAIIAVITVIAVGSIAEDARLASARNAITAGLDTARALAMKENKVILAAFRVRWAGAGHDQVTELLLTEWDGASQLNPQATYMEVIDRFVPVADVNPRALPAGIKVAGAWYDVERDDVWVTQPELRLTDPEHGSGEESHEGGRLIGVMFAPDGSVITFNQASNSDNAYIDFDRDGRQKDMGSGGSSSWIYDELDDEPYVEPVPFLAVYDDRAAREVRALDWSVSANYEEELTGPDGYITKNADRIHFNRYTGVVMR